MSRTSRTRGERHTGLLDGHSLDGCPTGRKRSSMGLAVQRMRSPGEGRVSFRVVGSDGLPVAEIEAFLTFLEATGASPNTLAGYAYDLKDFFTWLGQVDLGFETLTLEQVALFFSWLRRPKALRAPGVFMLPGADPAVENSTLRRRSSCSSCAPSRLCGADGSPQSPGAGRRAREARRAEPESCRGAGGPASAANGAGQFPVALRAGRPAGDQRAARSSATHPVGRSSPRTAGDCRERTGPGTDGLEARPAHGGPLESACAANRTGNRVRS